MTDLQKQILKALDKNIILSTRAISREVNKSYSQIFYKMRDLYMKGLVSYIDKIEHYPNSPATFNVKYWCLFDNKDKAKKILGVE